MSMASIPVALLATESRRSCERPPETILIDRLREDRSDLSSISVKQLSACVRTMRGRDKHSGEYLKWRVHSGVVCALLFSEALAKQGTNTAPPPTLRVEESDYLSRGFVKSSMPVTAAQKTAIEGVLKVIIGLTSSKKKRQLAEMFLELVDRESWADYYEVRRAASPIANAWS